MRGSIAQGIGDFKLKLTIFNNARFSQEGARELNPVLKVAALPTVNLSG